MAIHVDFTGVSSGFEKIEPGTYLARVSNIEERTSKAGKPYLNWEFTLIGGDVDGRKTWYMTSLAPNALWKLKDMLVKAFGRDKEEVSGNFELDPTDYIGEEVALIIGEEEYNGEMRDRVLDVVDSSAADDGPALL